MMIEHESEKYSIYFFVFMVVENSTFCFFYVCMIWCGLWLGGDLMFCIRTLISLGMDCMIGVLTGK